MTERSLSVNNLPLSVIPVREPGSRVKRHGRFISAQLQQIKLPASQPWIPAFAGMTKRKNIII